MSQRSPDCISKTHQGFLELGKCHFSQLFLIYKANDTDNKILATTKIVIIITLQSLVPFEA